MVAGVAGTVAAALRVEPGYEAAIGAALGSAADAALADGSTSALAALAWLSGEDRGRAAVLVPGVGRAGRAAWPRLPHDARYAADVVHADGGLAEPVAVLLDRVAVVEGDLESALELVRAHPVLLAVTRVGGWSGRSLVVGGSRSAPSRIEVTASLEAARRDLAGVAHDAERLRFELAALRTEREESARAADEALDRLHESDARMAAVADQLGNLGQQARAAMAEAERIDRTLVASEQALADDRATLDELSARLHRAQSAPANPAEPSPDARDEAARAAGSARRSEVDARLAVRTSEERARAIAGRAEQLERAAVSERNARLASAQRRERRARAAALAGAVAEAGAIVLARLEVSVAAAAEARTAAEQARAASDSRSPSCAPGSGPCPRTSTLTSSVHRDEVARAEQRLRIENLQGRALSEFGLEPDALMAEYGPEPSSHRRFGRPGTTSTRIGRSPPPTPTSGPSRSAACERRRRPWHCWAGSIRWHSRSSPPSRSGTASSPSSSTTSSARARTCSTSSVMWTPGWRRFSQRRSPTRPRSSSWCSPGCSPAVRVGSC